jgi:DNA-binding transcriptional LysR family regulator
LRQSLYGNGIRPDITHTASEHSTQLALVAAGMGVAIIPRLGREPVPDGVRVVEVRPALCRKVYALWRDSAAARPAIAAVVGELGTVAKAVAPSG